MSGVDFWGSYRQGQAAREFEDTRDIRMRGIEADVGRREFMLDEGKKVAAREDDWASGLGHLADAWQGYQSGGMGAGMDFRSYFQDYIRQANATNEGGIADWGTAIRPIPNDGKGIGYTKAKLSMPSGGGGGGGGGGGIGGGMSQNSGDVGAIASGGYY